MFGHRRSPGQRLVGEITSAGNLLQSPLDLSDGAAWANASYFDPVERVAQFSGGRAVLLTADGGAINWIKQSVGRFSGGRNDLVVWAERDSADTLSLELRDETQREPVALVRYHWSDGQVEVVRGARVQHDALVIDDAGPNGASVVRVQISATGPAGSARLVRIFPAGDELNGGAVILHGAMLTEADSAV